MTNHGFGIITLRSSKSNEAAKMNIAKCISNVPGIVYAHAVHQVFTGDSEDEMAKKMRAQEDSQWDIVFEMERGLSRSELDDIYACAREEKHESSLTLITTKHPNYQRGHGVKHP